MNERSKSNELSFQWLSEKPELSPILAHWSFLEWYTKRDIPFRVNMMAYQERAANRNIPVTRIALVGDLPVAMASIKKDDLWNRKDLNPWLASVYVVPEFRNRGIGKSLIENLISLNKELSINSLYLFLGQSDQKRLKKFYENLGWTFLSKGIDNDGLPTEIFIKDFE